MRTNIAEEFKTPFNIKVDLDESHKNIADALTTIFYPTKHYSIYENLTDKDTRPLCMISHQFLYSNVLQENSAIGICKRLRTRDVPLYILSLEQIKKYLVLYHINQMPITKYINQLLLDNQLKRIDQ